MNLSGSWNHSTALRTMDRHPSDSSKTPIKKKKNSFPCSKRWLLLHIKLTSWLVQSRGKHALWCGSDVNTDGASDVTCRRSSSSWWLYKLLGSPHHWVAISDYDDGTRKHTRYFNVLWLLIVGSVNRAKGGTCRYVFDEVISVFIHRFCD